MHIPPFKDGLERWC